VQNKTDYDYSLTNLSDIQLFLNDAGTLDDWTVLSVDLPLYIPAKHTVNVTIHFRMIETEQPKNNTKEEIDRFLRDKDRVWNGYDSFVLLDKVRRYQIDFPMGW
jgi:hypothetical protein